MRGKDAHASDLPSGAGITPAYAGKRCSLQVTMQQSWDHPRLCGEKYRKISIGQPVLGSPPPMRGKADLQIWSHVAVGITPAYAGKSSIDKIGDTMKEGSPPPMRGKAWMG